MTDSEPPDFDQFYRREWSRLTALGWSLTGSWSGAEELAQEALVDAHRRWETVGRLDKPGTWVRRAVLNRSVSYRRRRHAEARALGRWGASAGADSATGSDESGVGPDEAELWAAERSLPGRQAHCLTLHYLEDRSVAEIAAVLGCKSATVRVHLHRGRRNLARKLSVRTAEMIPLEPIDAADEEEGWR